VSDPQQVALAALREGRLEEAERAYRELLARHAHPAFLTNLALVLVRQRREAEAIPLLEQAIGARPGDVNPRVVLSNALLHCDRAAEALACCEGILAIDPRQRDAHHNRAVALRALTRNEEAAAAMRALLAADPDDADAEFNLALAELMLGDHGRGWAHYEARWRGATPQPPLPPSAIPLWRVGETLEGRAVLLQAEQGLGDTIQFLQFVPRAIAACGRVAIQLPVSLHAIVRRAFPGVDLHATDDTPSSGFDVRLGFMSLPLALRIGDPGGAEPYLAADAQRVAAWRERIPHNPALAIAWRGSPTLRKDRQRSMPLATLVPLLDRAAERKETVIAVQRDITAAERAQLAHWSNVIAPGDELRDFDDTAACLSIASHVACVDTAVIHLAGALGRPTTVLLHFASEWRWGIDRPAGATYRSVRTLRQPSPGDWDSVVRMLIVSLP
jgi:tetratricopeptide (TPR) repeat protein